MSARIRNIGFKRVRPRARLMRIGFREHDMRFLTVCDCGFRHTAFDLVSARAEKRSHDAEHRRAEQAHPAGKARPGGGGVA